MPPGEWFTRWIVNRSADTAQGARWIAANATHFLFFVDRAALASKDVGKARNEILTLAEGAGEHRAGDARSDMTKSDEKTMEAVENHSNKA